VPGERDARKKIQWTPAQEKGEGKTKGLVGKCWSKANVAKRKQC
jgi:hypothetical protein